MGFVDSVFDGTKGVFKLVVVLAVVSALGGVLGALADIAIPGVIAGTPLGPESGLSPLAWTAIAGGLLYGGMEVLG